MRFHRATRIASLAVVVAMTLATLRSAAPRACADEHCRMPCCDRDVDNHTIIPIFPCCRAWSIDRDVSRRPSITVENQRSLVAAADLPVGVAPASSATPRATRIIARHLPAPPLYHRHCALLL